MKSIRTGRRQYGVIPFRRTPSGRLEVLLITSRGTGRWVIPKGWPMMAKTPQEAAAIEAFEEAGVRGQIVDKIRLGSYRYQKLNPSGLVGKLTVGVFLMKEDEQLGEWPEQGERTAQWFNPSDAAAHVAEPALGKMLRQLPRLIGAAGIEFIYQNGGASGVRLRSPGSR
jgi:8-oxo-dGTP pyrophosphatase MutT (NUDIX family)